MLSRLALRSTAALWRPRTIQSASIFTATSEGHKGLIHDEDVKSLVARWDKYNKMWYGPDRDFKNFPSLRIPDHKPAVRLGFIPSTWFDAFYEKTGATGPYVLLTFGGVFLLSKEYIVWEHALMEVIMFTATAYILMRFAGPKLRDFTNKDMSDFYEKYWFEPLRESVEEAQEIVDQIGASSNQADTMKYIAETKRDNVDLQLEAAYRKRLVEVHQAVKRRLDYQVEKENAAKQFEQKHMVNWIIQNVMKSITPQQEKDTLNRCIQDLKALSASARV